MREFILWLLIIFIIKILENLIGTAKTLLVQKNKALLAALSVVITQVMFYKIIAEVSAAEGFLVIFIISIASGMGTLIAVKLGDKFSKERIYVNVILSDDKEFMIELIEFLRRNKITNLASDAYTRDWTKTIAVTAYAETKDQSKLLDSFLHNKENYKRIIQ